MASTKSDVFSSTTRQDVATSDLVFAPVWGRVWVARIFGGLFLFLAVGMNLVLLEPTLDAGVRSLLVLLSLPLWAFGLWMLFFASRLAHLRTTIQEDGLQIVGLTSRRIWPFRRVPWRQAFIPWTDVQGLVATPMPNPFEAGGEERTYMLYTAQGDFYFTNLHWQDIDRLMSEISQRSGRSLDAVAPERQLDVTQLRVTLTREWRFLRLLGWVSVIVASFFSLAIVALVWQGDYVVAGKVGMITASLLGIGAGLLQWKR